MDSTIYIAFAVPLALCSYIGYLWLIFEIDKRKSQDAVDQ